MLAVNGSSADLEAVARQQGELHAEVTRQARVPALTTGMSRLASWRGHRRLATPAFPTQNSASEMTNDLTHPPPTEHAAVNSAVSSPTVVIGCPDSPRATALKHAIVARGPLVVTETWPPQQALAAGRNPDTAVVILDRYPSRITLRAMADVTAAHPDLGVLVIGPLQPNIDVLIALASGAAGYLPSGSPPPAVAHAVETLLAGHIVLPRAVSLPLVHDLRWQGHGILVTRPNRHDAELTNREWEVLVLLRQARSTAEIARRLSVSQGTIRTHVAAVLHKLDVHDRSTLT